MPSLPPLSAIAEAQLKPQDGDAIAAGTLWEKQPVIVIIIRRPGCILCRDEAQKLWGLKPEMDKMGIGLVCVVHQWIQREIDAFREGYWGGLLFHDVDKAFYKALNDGKVLRGSMVSMMNPFGAAWGRVKEAQKNVKDSNLVGDGLTMGGMMVVGAGSEGVKWMHLETDFGLLPTMEEVMEQAKKVAVQ